MSFSERQISEAFLAYEDTRDPKIIIKVYKSLGMDVYISPLADIKRPHLCKIGNHSAIDSFTAITTAADIGDHCHISYSVSVIGGPNALLKMGHFTNIAAGARVICLAEEHRGAGLINPTIPESYRDTLVGGKVELKPFAEILSNAVVTAGLTLGEGSMVGAGAVLLEDTEPWTVYVGVPARPIKKRPSELMLKYAKEMGY